MLLRSFFVKYFFRRIDVFRKNADFNENEQYEGLGTLLMDIMFAEIKRSLSTSEGSLDGDFQQLIYDYSDPDDPKFRLFATQPEKLDEEARARFKKFAPLLVLPAAEESRNRDVLDRYLVQAMAGLELDATGRVPEIDREGFILTIDFVAKMLNMYERMKCQLPCIMEGETGVSKTALTRMFSILINASVERKAVAYMESTLACADTSEPEALVQIASGLPSFFEPPSEELLCSAKAAAAGDDDQSCEPLLAYLRTASIVKTYVLNRAQT